MLPSRPPRFDAALRTLEPALRSDQETRLRVTLLDGSLMEGTLVTLGEGHLSLENAAEELQYVPIDQIATLEIGVRRTFREFVVVSGMIAVVVTALVAAATVPFLRTHALTWIAVQLSIFTFAGIG